MIRFVHVFFLALVLVLPFTLAAEEKELLIDDFEDGTIEEAPAWWTFGAIEASVVDVPDVKTDKLAKLCGNKVLKIAGETDAWYIGGMGTYVGKEAAKLTHIKMMVYGNGPKSGRLTIQLYDDDNGNTELEQDVEKNYEPIYDDRFEYTMDIDWRGWKVVLIPISKFKDTNPKVGDNIWNPNNENGSIGVLHFQFIFMANNKKGNFHAFIDNIKLISLNAKQ